MRALTLLAALAPLAGCGGGAADRPVRIVLVTVDTLRHDALTDELMPFTTGRARAGQVFEQSYAATSTTQPTHASLLTGLHPWQHGVTRNGIVLDERFETVAERLHRAGFRTAAVVASFPLHEMFGYGQGFDEYHDDFDEPYVQVWEDEPVEGESFYSLAESVTGAAIDALDRSTGSRQFFWFHYFDPHDPYGDGPSPDGDRSMVPISALLDAAGEGEPESTIRLLRVARRFYDRDLAGLDRSLERLFARIEQDVARFETHVVFTADHGESFGELGCLGHGKRLTREQVQVPLFVLSPALAPGVRREPAGSVDVARTLLSLAGVAAPDVPGRDLTTAAPAGGVFGMRRTFATPKVELLVDGSVLPVEGERFYTVRSGVLYSGDDEQVLTEDDPARELSGPEAPELRRLFEALEAQLAGVQAPELLAPEVQEALRKLGYAR